MACLQSALLQWIDDPLRSISATLAQTALVFTPRAPRQAVVWFRSMGFCKSCSMFRPAARSTTFLFGTLCERRSPLGRV